MTTIIISHRTTVAMMNSIHVLLSENHPCTLFMVSLHPGYHDPLNSIHYHIPRIDDGKADGAVLLSQLAAGPILLVGLALGASSLRPSARGSFYSGHTVAHCGV